MNHFRELWDLGYRRIVPVVPPGAPISPKSRLARNPRAIGKIPGERGSDGLWYGKDLITCEATERDLENWHAMGAGVGMKCGEGLIGIDVDTRKPELVRTIVNIITGTFGLLPARIGRAPKILFPVRVRGPLDYHKIEFGEPNEKGVLERVEVLSDKKFFVAHGIHPDTLQPYTWPHELVPFDELKEVSPEDVLAMLRTLGKVLPKARPITSSSASSKPPPDQKTLKGDLAMVRRAVLLIPNRDEDFNRDQFVELGIAIKAALPDHPQEAFEIWSEWAGRWDAPPPARNTEEMLDKEWRGMKPPFRKGASWVYELAEKYSGGKLQKAEMWFDKMLSGPGLAGSESAPAASGTPWELVTFQESIDKGLALNSSSAPLIKGFLDQGALSILYGESNVGKSFVAMDIGFHIVAGLAWAGMRTTRVGVLYIAAEGGAGVHKRIKALELKYGPACHGIPFYFRTANVNLLRADADLADLIATIRSVGPVGLVIIDTLSRAMSGGDENASTDMGALVKHIDIVRNVTGAHVMAVHHSGKDRARGARGHSLLRAATDTEIEIAENQILVTKQRDLDKEFSSAFVLDPVELGRDADGDAVTSCTVRLVTKGEVPAGEATPEQQEVLDAIEDVMERGKVSGAARQDIMAQMGANGVKSVDKESVKGVLRRLLEKRLVRKVSRYLWALNTINVAKDPLDDVFK